MNPIAKVLAAIINTVWGHGKLWLGQGPDVANVPHHIPSAPHLALVGHFSFHVAHVVGIDDPERGQLVVAALRVPPGHEAPDTDELRSALRKQLSAYKVPQRFLALPDDGVPMLSSGKLDARALKDLFHDG